MTRLQKQKIGLVCGVLLCSVLGLNYGAAQKTLPDKSKGGESSPIYLMTGTLHPSSSNNLFYADRGTRENAGPYYILQMTGPIRQDWTRELTSLGVRL